MTVRILAEDTGRDLAKHIAIAKRLMTDGLTTAPAGFLLVHQPDGSISVIGGDKVDALVLEHAPEPTGGLTSADMID
jgi:hypothetical protein